MITQREAAVLLNMSPEIGPVRFRNLKKHFSNLADIFIASPDAFRSIEGMSENLSRNLLKFGRENRESAVRELETAKANGIRILCYDDPGYPSLLKAAGDCPPVLYCKGHLKCLNDLSVALVGTRRSTAYGEKVAENLSGSFSRMGIVTVSGLARGIDTVVHRETIRSGGKTIAVLGSGLLRIYPPENRTLAEQVTERGLLISEFSLFSSPDQSHFPRRNRIIAGLSLGTVVVEAGERSGALITARLALEQGKDVFAVPGPITSKMSAGPHRLIQEGAKLVRNIGDIIEEINPLKDRIAADPVNFRVSLTLPEKKLLNLLEPEPVHVDYLTDRSSLGIGELSQSLLNLEMKGAIKSLPGKMYARQS